MGGKQSSVTSERYQPTSTGSPSIGGSESTPRTFHPRSDPPVSQRSNESRDVRHPPPPEPPPFSSLFFTPPLTSQPSPPPPPLPPRLSTTATDSLAGRQPSNLANRPLPRLPTSSSSSGRLPPNRHERFLDLEALLAGLDEIGPPETRSRTRSTHHRPHRSRYRERNLTMQTGRAESNRDILDDPLSFLRSLTSKNVTFGYVFFDQLVPHVLH